MLGRLGHRSEKLLVPLGTLHSLSGWRTPNSFRVGRQVNREAGSSLQNHRLASLLYAARGHAKRRVGGGGGDSLGPPVCAGGGGGGVRERQGRGHGSPCTVLCRLVNLLENRHYPSKLWGWGGGGGRGGVCDRGRGWPPGVNVHRGYHGRSTRLGEDGWGCCGPQEQPEAGAPAWVAPSPRVSAPTLIPSLHTASLAAGARGQQLLDTPQGIALCASPTGSRLARTPRKGL